MKVETLRAATNAMAVVKGCSQADIAGEIIKSGGAAGMGLLARARQLMEACERGFREVTHA